MANAMAAGPTARERVVPLPVAGGEVVVKKWSLAKLIAATEFTDQLGADFKEAVGEEVTGFRRIFEIFGIERICTLMRISVRPEDESKISPDMDSDDAMEVLQAVSDLNWTPEYTKKVGRLVTILMAPPKDQAKEPAAEKEKAAAAAQ